MKSFEYATPNTVEEACELLADTWGETEVLAGGTDLITCMKQGLTSPKRVVSLKNIAELKEIKKDGDTLTVGAMATLSQLLEHDFFQSFAQAINGIGARQMIAQGTVGGDLLQRPRCWYFRNGYGLLNKNLVENGDNRYHAIFGNDGAAAYVHPSSLAPAFMSVGVTVHIAGPGGATREIGVHELFQTPTVEGQREHTLKPNEIVTGFSYLRMDVHRNTTYEVRHRHGLDWPYVTASVKPNGAMDDHRPASVVLGHVAPVPWACEEAGKILADGFNEENAVKAAEAAVAGATPLSGNAYKVAMVKTAVKRAVMTIAEDRERYKKNNQLEESV